MYSDPDYARSSARGALVAPPLFPIAAGLPSGDPREGLELDQVLEGYMQAIAGDRWTLCRPVRAGVRLMRERRLAAAVAAGGGWDLVVRTTYRAGPALYAVHDRGRRYRLYERGGGATRRPDVRLGRYDAAAIAR